MVPMLVHFLVRMTADCLVRMMAQSWDLRFVRMNVFIAYAVTVLKKACGSAIMNFLLVVAG